MTIIQANLTHLDQVATLFNQYRIFYRQTPNLEGATQFIKDRLTKQDSIILIAFAEKKPVGFTQLFHSFSSVSMLTFIYIKRFIRK